MSHNTIDVPQLVRSEKRDRVRDRQMVTQQLYIPPLDGSADPHREFDAFIAGRVHEILAHHYPGYTWNVKCSAQQGMIYFQIPILMGPTLHQTIRLAQWHDLCPELVIDAGGHLLERLNLPRTGFEVNSFLKARDNRHLAQFGDDIGKGRF
jgi:hypothetical protein